jgi:hypothetical protein
MLTHIHEALKNSSWLNVHGKELMTHIRGWYS